MNYLISPLSSRFLTLMLLAGLAGIQVYAGGTIQLNNTTLTRVTWLDGRTPVPTTSGLVLYGVKWGTNPGALTLAPKFATNSAAVAGLISGDSTFEIPETVPGQSVYLQIVGWRACDGIAPDPRFGCEPYGETDVRLVTLGPTSGPGTVIWQPASGFSPERFHPLNLGSPLTPPAKVEFYDSTFGSPITIDEGAHGTANVPVRLIRTTIIPGRTLSNVTTTVWLVTSNGTAVGGTDFESGAEMITFAPGETFKVGHVRLLPDFASEPVEQFQVHLRLGAGSQAALSSLPLPVNIREARVADVRVETNQPIVTVATTVLQRYALESSPDLMAWSTVPGAEAIQGNGQNIEIRDPAPPPACCEPRFYRLQILP